MTTAIVVVVLAISLYCGGWWMGRHWATATRGRREDTLAATVRSMSRWLLRGGKISRGVLDEAITGAEWDNRVGINALERVIAECSPAEVPRQRDPGQR